MVAMADISSDKIDATFWTLALEKHAKRKAIVCLDDVELDGSDSRFIGAIHHITRCGSTTLLQQFGALDRIFALSEPFVFLELLGRASADRSKAALRVRKLACLFGKAFAPVADQIVVKWPTLLCRHALVLNQALPDVASVLIVRDAVEILASIEARPLGNMESVASDLLCGPDESITTDPAPVGLTLTARVLAANCRWIAQSKSTRLVEYTRLPSSGWQDVAPHFGLELTDAQIAAMQSVASTDAKSPHRAFANDTDKKRREASPLAQILAQQILRSTIDEARAALKSF
jgi:hypothetical protein